jgi:hypothetical protein
MYRWWGPPWAAPTAYLRFDTKDYSLDSRLAARRAEVRVSQTNVTAAKLRHDGAMARALDRSEI